MAELTVLLICADLSLIRSVQEIVDSISQLHLLVVSSMKEARSLMGEGEIPLILVHSLNKEDSLNIEELLQDRSGSEESPAVIVLAEEHRPKEALHLLRRGARDYLSRPLDLSRLAYLVDSLTVRQRVLERSPVPKSVCRLGTEDPFFYSDSTDMGSMMQQVQRVAPQDTTLLLGGETGTGKTRLARLVHELSPRREQPFLVVNCGSLSENLIESDLFGHVRGAFTGADRDRTGKFAAAGQGTLLLDEIDALPLPLQAKFLRSVEERVFEQLGSNKLLPMRARLITASNRVLDEEVAAGRFRADLFYRLNVVAFFMPPLRERKAIVGELADHYLAEFAARNHRPVTSIDDQALRALLAYDWPGNIRELRNVMERAVALCPGKEIELADLPSAVQVAASLPRAALAPTHRVDSASPQDMKLRHAKGEAEAAWIVKALGK